MSRHAVKCSVSAFVIGACQFIEGDDEAKSEVVWKRRSRGEGSEAA